MTVLRLAFASLWNRRSTVVLTVLAIAMSVALLLTVERVRHETRNSFANTVSGTDLIVGARSGSVQLLLYSVFRIGNATNNISWESYQDISRHPEVEWMLPVSLGDSHRGFRVMGTSQAYFTRFSYGRKRQLRFTDGQPFDDVFDAVLGAKVASALGYELGQSIIMSHGLGEGAIYTHDGQPFQVSGILAPTGTPVDRTIHVSLEGIEAMHVDWQQGAKIPGKETSLDEIRQRELIPKAVTAALIGLKRKTSTFRVQRFINEYREEPLLAILPGVALQELWGLLGVAEKALFLVSLFVVLAGLVGLVAVLMAGLAERRREMAILRSVGARPWQVFGLLCLESLLLTLLAIGVGLLLFYAVFLLGSQWLSSSYGLDMTLGLPLLREWGILGILVLAGLLAGVLPGLRAYGQSLADGMSIRV